MRSFCPNGAVDPQQHFFVSPTKWNEENLLHRLLNGAHTALIAPSQTGKTTRVATLKQQLLTCDTVLPLYVDISMVVTSQSPFFDSFVRSLRDAILVSTHHHVNITAKDWGTLFRAENDWFFGKEVILLLDEIDALSASNNQERFLFLSALRSIKQSRIESSIYGLRSVLIVTNHLGTYLQDTIGNSPFNINDMLEAPYFTQEEFNSLLGQYETQEQITINDKIKTDMYKNTCGAQGLSVMYASNFHYLRQREERNPSFSNWLNFSNSNDFVTRIMTYPNYSRMIRMIEGDNESKQVLVQMFYAPDRVRKIPANLITSNALLKSGVFANPFVRTLIASSLYSPSPPSNYTFPLNGERVDMYQVICDAISCMNPLEIAGAPKKKKTNCIQNPIDKGPKEIVYVLAFKRALENMLMNYRLQIHPEYEVEGKSCDMILSIHGETIAIEHGANLIVTPKSKERMSVEHHVKSQAEYYHSGLKAHQTWMINWTTVPHGHGAQQVQYYFPKSDTVNTLYIYHDTLFKKIEVESKMHSTTIDIPFLDLKARDHNYESQLSQRILEPESKRRKYHHLSFPNTSVSHEAIKRYIKVRKHEKKKGSILVDVSDEVKDVTALLDLICEKLTEDKGTRVTLRTADEDESLIQDLKHLQFGKLYHALKQDQEEMY